jgi:hypothetical protein
MRDSKFHGEEESQIQKGPSLTNIFNNLILSLPDRLGTHNCDSLVACRREFVTTHSARGIGVLPPNRTSISRVGVHVSAELSRQVGDGSEDAASNEIVAIMWICWRAGHRATTSLREAKKS